MPTSPATLSTAHKRRAWPLAIAATFLLVVAGIVLSACASDRQKVASHERSPASLASLSELRPLKRGLNLSRWWEEEHDRALESSDIDRIRAMGFDFVRLPLDTRALENKNRNDDSEKGADSDRLNALRHDLERLIESGFSVVLDLHPKDDFQRRLTNLPPEEARRILEDFWRSMSETLKGLPPERLLIQILNEPKFGTNRWWKIQEELIAALRPIYPRNAFVATTSPDSGWWQLEDLKPYKDPNTLYDFHFYEPMIFTHHQVEWAKNFDPKRAALPVPYPVDPENPSAAKTEDPAIRAYLRQNWNREKLAKLVGKISAWKERHKARLVCLEFGVYAKHVDERSRLNWLRDMREEFEKNGIPWAMWEYKGPFGLLPVDAGHGDAPETSMIEALGLDNGDLP